MTFSSRIHTVFCLFILGLYGCVPLGEPITGSEPVAKTPEYYAQRTLNYEDHIYNEKIKTVQFYAGTGTAEEVLTPAIIPVDQTIRAVLEFDELNTAQQRFMVKLVNCNADWKPSNLADIQFVNQYNETLYYRYPAFGQYQSAVLSLQAGNSYGKDFRQFSGGGNVPGRKLRA